MIKINNNDFYETEEALHMDTSVLAFLGDAIYSLWVRMYLIKSELHDLDKLHKKTVFYVNADAQAEALKGLGDLLTEEEADIARRARNKKVNLKGRNIKPVIYKKSTAFEALVGFLWITGQEERLDFLLTEAIGIIEDKKVIEDKKADDKGVEII